VIGVLCGALLSAIRPVREVPAWTCGSPVSAAHQYTATAFSKPLRRVFSFLLQPQRERTVERGPSPWLPRRIWYRTQTRAVIDEAARAFTALLLTAVRQSRIVQNGSLRLYLVYMGVAVAVVSWAAR